MDALSSKQIRYLRGLGNRLKSTVHVGQQGISDPLLEAIEDAFKNQELVKVKLQEGFEGERRKAGSELAEKSASALVQVLGKTILLYREHPDEPEIKLPI